jgi:single-stranded-DNA-specific exonuclease
MEKRWFVKKDVENERCELFRQEIKTDRVLATLLLQRGIDSFDSANHFFNPDLSNLHDPYLMKGMTEATERLGQAIVKREKILLFGDYDVDGTTAVALMYSFLKQHTEYVDYYIPDRYKEGYGLSLQGIVYAEENNVDLMISLDCGIRSVELIALARSKGIDFIVCDHHEPGPVIPNGIILDPKQKECSYPYKGLSGCGVGFKLLQGLCSYKQLDIHPLFELLDLVAVSIGADIVDITDENRILAFHGLKQLNASPRPAFSELLTLAGKEPPVTLSTVVFTIAPRINAAGRLRSGRYAVELMISNNQEEIERIAREINEDNQQRRGIDQEITKEAIAMIEADNSFESMRSLVLYNENWHKGVVGIVASRLVERYFRPTIILTSSNEMATGSARTVNDFDIHAAISECGHLLEQFGGHCHAAGLSLKPLQVDQFREAFEQTVRSRIRPEDLAPELCIDLEISFDELFRSGENRFSVPRLKRNLLRFEPHGPGNLQPIFMTRNVYAIDSRVLKEKHLKLTLVDPFSDTVVQAIGFDLVKKADQVAAGIPFDIAYTLEINAWNGKESLQLNIRDIRTSICDKW